MRTGGIRRPVRVLATLAVVALAAGTAGPSSASAQHGPQRTAQQTSQPREATSPFTGLPAEPAPVMAVKIDNHKDARPHTALEDADIVFVEKVEGGLSRLLGLYSSKFPEGMGPVRSARAYNVEQLRMFDRPVLAYSGAREGVVDLIEKSPLYGVSHDDFPDAYFRGGDNEAPHNLYAHPDKILAEAPDASESKDIGFRFADDGTGGRRAHRRALRRLRLGEDDLQLVGGRGPLAHLLRRRARGEHRRQAAGPQDSGRTEGGDAAGRRRHAVREDRRQR